MVKGTNNHSFDLIHGSACQKKLIRTILNFKKVKLFYFEISET